MSKKKFEGKNYNQAKGLSTKEIAELIRQEIKIMYPEGKVSVKTDVFAGGSAIRVSIKDIGYNPFSKEFDSFMISGGSPDEFFSSDRFISNSSTRDNLKYSPAFLKDIAKIKEIHQSYNFDDSDVQVDYFHVNYYGQVETDDSEFYLKYYPTSEYSIKKKAREDKYKQIQQAASLKRKEAQKEILFKRWDIVWFEIKYQGGKVIKHFGIITKGLNGTGKWSAYSVQILEPALFMSEREIVNYKENDPSRHFTYELSGQLYIRKGRSFEGIATRQIEAFDPTNDEHLQMLQQVRIQSIKNYIKYKKWLK